MRPRIATERLGRRHRIPDRWNPKNQDLTPASLARPRNLCVSHLARGRKIPMIGKVSPFTYGRRS